MHKEYRLPEGLRPRLAKPMGRLFSPDEMKSEEFKEAVLRAPMVITVGDRVTETIGKLGRVPDVQVIDGRENRKDRELPNVPFSRLVKVTNPAGTVTQQAIDGIREAFEGGKPVRVLVEGEEDLLAIPVIAIAPLSANVFYGQPREGIVVVGVGADTKSMNRGILAEMGITDLR